MYLQGITQNHHDEQLSTSLMHYDMEAFFRAFGRGGGRMPPFYEWLDPALNPRWEVVPSDAPYSRELVLAWSEAVRRGLASNYAFARLDATKLRRSGWGRA